MFSRAGLVRSMFFRKNSIGSMLQLGGEIVQSAHGEHGGLRMVGSAPCASRTNVVANGGVLLVADWEC